MLKARGNLLLNPVGLSISPRKYTMRMMLDTLPTAPRAMTILTEILERRSRLLSRRTEMGISTKVQSAIMLIAPYMYPVVMTNGLGKQLFEPRKVSAILVGLPHAKMVVRT
jgi:hypothetical protein